MDGVTVNVSAMTTKKSTLDVSNKERLMKGLVIEVKAAPV